jgi:inner membrane transporter RhtA
VLQQPTQPRSLSPVLLLLLAMISIQSGAAFSKGLFNTISPIGLAALRMALAAMVLGIVVRPRLGQYTARDHRFLALLGVTIAAMNVLLYSAIARIPIGVAVTLEFLGPLGVALAHSRRSLDVVWVILAATGIALLMPLEQNAVLDPVGVLLALLSGGCWATYILLSAEVTKTVHGGDVIAGAIACGAIVVFPLGLATDGLHLLLPSSLLIGLGIGIMATALPYSLEIMALRRLPVKVFGVLMSLEPVVASCAGLFLLGEQLTLRMILAIALVTLASAGSARG